LTFDLRRSTRRRGEGGKAVAFVALALISLAVFAFGVPAG
jgi:hypothetical protein